MWILKCLYPLTDILGLGLGLRLGLGLDYLKKLYYSTVLAHYSRSITICMDPLSTLFCVQGQYKSHLIIRYKKKTLHDERWLVRCFANHRV